MSADTIARTAFKQGTKPLYDYDKHWASCYEPAPYLPMSRKEMDDLGWDAKGFALGDNASGGFGFAVDIHAVAHIVDAEHFFVGSVAGFLDGFENWRHG